VAAVAILVSSFGWGGHPPVEHPAVVTVVPTPLPTASPKSTITPLPPLSYQPVPGVSPERAAAIVSRCSGSVLRGSDSILDPGSATLEDLVENRVGSVAIIDAPLRADAKAPVRPGVPNLGHSLLFICQLGPDDTIAGMGFGGMLYQDHAIPGPLLVDGSYGSSTNSPTSKTGSMKVIHGRVARNVARVVWDTPDGQHVSADIRNGYFLTSPTDVSDGTGQGHLRAYDKAGHELAITGTYPTLGGSRATTYWP
jgi:hypothetical protein